MSQETDLKFNTLYDSAFTLLQSIDSSQKYSNELLQGITQENINFQHNNRVFNQQNNLLEKLIEKTDSTITNTIDKRSNDIAKSIVNSIHKEFKQANNYANEASEIYKGASNKIVYKVVLLSFFIFIIFSSVIYFGYKYFLEEKYNKLKDDIAYLEINKQKLISSGASLDIRFDKENRIYVRVDMKTNPQQLKGEINSEFMLVKQFNK